MIAQGGKIVCLPFHSMTGNKASISDFIPTGENTYDSVTAQLLDKLGATLNNMIYTWTEYGSDDGIDFDKTGWVDQDYMLVSDVNLNLGEALWISGVEENQGIQSSGKIMSNEISMALCDGGIMVGNIYPTTITIGDIAILGEGVYDTVTLQFLDEYGGTKDNVIYTWTEYGSTDGIDFDKVGWVNQDYMIVTDLQIDVGCGIWITGSADPSSEPSEANQVALICPNLKF